MAATPEGESTGERAKFTLSWCQYEGCNQVAAAVAEKGSQHRSAENCSFSNDSFILAQKAGQSPLSW